MRSGGRVKLSAEDLLEDLLRMHEGALCKIYCEEKASSQLQLAHLPHPLVDELGKAVYRLSLLQGSPEINRLGEAVAHTNHPLCLSFSWLLVVPWCTLCATGLLAEEKIYYLALLDLWWGYTTVRIYVATGDLLYLSVPPSS